MKNRIHILILLLVIKIMIINLTNVFSQDNKISLKEKTYYLHSGIYNGDRIDFKNVFKRTIYIENANWFRIFFGQVNLGNESFIVIRSILDNSEQKLNSISITQWKNTSAYFNGNVFEISLYVSPNDVNIYFEVHKLIYNDTQKGYSWRGICGQTDDRQPTQFKAVGRIFKSDGDIGTCWILFNGKLVTAQHCLSAMNVDVIQFNVPNSYLNGVIRHPGPEDQYVVDNESIISGDDWAIFDVYANSVTGLTPKESQNNFYFVTNDIPDPQSNNVNITITGYGVAAGILNCTQQTASGLINYIEGNILYCQVDATEGTSGGPIVMVGT